MQPTSPVEITASAPVPLRRNRNFQLLWTGSATAFIALFTAELAFPLVILAKTGSPGLTSLFGVTQMTAAVLFGIPAGRLLDRYDRRRVLVLAEAARALVLGTVVFAFWADRVTVAHLLAVAALIGGIQPFGAARMLLLRAAVPPAQLTTAVTAEEVRTNAAELSGPPLGGLLYGIAPVLPFAFATAMFVASATMASFVRVPPAPRSESGSPDGMFAGLATVLRDPTMRAVVAMITFVNGIAWAAQLVIVVLLQQLGTPPWRIGVAIAGFAVGGLVGAGLVKVLHRALRPGVLLLAVVLFDVPVLLLMAVPHGAWWVGALCLCFGLGVPAVRVLIDILILRQIPDEQRGRALSGVMTIFTLSVPAAIGGAGLLLQYFSPAVTLTVFAGMLFVGVCYTATRRSIRRAEWPVADG